MELSWGTDKSLINVHVKLGGILKGKSLDLCCGTGAVSRALEEAGWDAHEIDIPSGMLPFPDRTFDLITMRQAYSQLENGPAVLQEVRRVLKPSGRFIFSQTVPFSINDASNLKAIHSARGGSDNKFFNTETLIEELQRNAFGVVKKTFVVVRESVTSWLESAPELSSATRQSLSNLVVNGPEGYRKQRNVEVRNGEIFEDWNFIVLLAQPRPN